MKQQKIFAICQNHKILFFQSNCIAVTFSGIIQSLPSLWPTFIFQPWQCMNKSGKTVTITKPWKNLSSCTSNVNIRKIKFLPKWSILLVLVSSGKAVNWCCLLYQYLFSCLSFYQESIHTKNTFSIQSYSGGGRWGLG